MLLSYTAVSRYITGISKQSDWEGETRVFNVIFHWMMFISSNIHKISRGGDHFWKKLNKLSLSMVKIVCLGTYHPGLF